MPTCLDGTFNIERLSIFFHGYNQIEIDTKSKKDIIGCGLPDIDLKEGFIVGECVGQLMNFSRNATQVT